MKKLDFSKSSPDTLNRLSRAEQAVDDFCKKHPNNLTDTQHNELRSLLNERASALTDALGTRVHSLFDD